MKLNLRLFLSKDKKRNDNSYPIVISCYSSKLGKNIHKHIGLTIPKSYWDKKRKKIAQTYPNHDYLNARLKHVLEEYSNAHVKLLDTMPDLEDVHRQVLADRESKRQNDNYKILINAIQLYIDKFKPLKSHNYIRNIERCIGYVKAFRPNVICEEIDEHFWIDFYHFLVQEKKLSDMTIKLTFNSIRRVLKFIRKKGVQINLEFDSFKLNASSDEKFALTKEEVLKLAFMKLEDDQLLARDIFIFSCCTGYRIGDMLALKKHNISPDYSFVQVNEIKTNKSRRIPLNNLSAKVAKYYCENNKNQSSLFPEITESKCNRHIRKVALAAKLDRIVSRSIKSGSKIKTNESPIHDVLSLHIGRHTFVTLILKLTKDIVETKNIVGHSSIETTLGYAHLSEKNEEVVIRMFE